MLAGVTYSTSDFELYRKKNIDSALTKGKVDKYFEFTEKDIDESFFRKNEKILTQKTGAGLWLWKPYFINKAFSYLQDDDYLIYSDAASFFIGDIHLLIENMEFHKQSIMVFELPLVSHQWTKSETFTFMNCFDDCYKLNNQILASFMIFKKNTFSSTFISEFLSLCTDERLICSEQYTNIENPSNFMQHRYDQSIFSILCYKYKLLTFRDPSQFGSLPWTYVTHPNVIYKPKSFINSNYPTIIVHTRRREFTLFDLLKIRVKIFLSQFKFYQNFEIKRHTL